MSGVRLAFGYDTERPYGTLAASEQAPEVRRTELDCVRRLNDVFSSYGVPRTFFVLGEFLERCLDTESRMDLAHVFCAQDGLAEVQQHSYLHQLYRPIPGRSDKKVMTAREFGEDLGHAQRILQSVLGVTPTGLRVPLGYASDLFNRADILAELETLGLMYVSSQCRGNEESLRPPLNSGRQPHTYAAAGYPSLAEIPSHGWQDVIFTRAHAHKELGRPPDPPEKALAHYKGLLDQAESMVQKKGTNVYVCLSLHPWAVSEWDPELVIHRGLLDAARNRGVDVVSYGAVAEEVRGGA